MKLFNFNCREYKDIPPLPLKNITFETDSVTFEITSVTFETSSESIKFEVGKSYDKLLHIIHEKIEITSFYRKTNGNFCINFNYDINGNNSSVLFY
jgi:hypothetical protein